MTFVRCLYLNAKKPFPPARGNGFLKNPVQLHVVRDRAERNRGNGYLGLRLDDDLARIVFAGDRGDATDVVVSVSADQVRVLSLSNALVEHVLGGGSGNLAKIVHHGFLTGLGAHLAEGGNGHRSQEADDDHDDHNFHQREALVGSLIFIIHDILSSLWFIHDMGRVCFQTTLSTCRAKLNKTKHLFGVQPIFVTGAVIHIFLTNGNYHGNETNAPAWP
jgi:hypothetical protein